MGGVDDARWQTGDQLHLTLRFIGEADDDCARRIREALSKIRHPPFDLSIRGVGAFDRRGHIHALWAGVTPSDPLHALQAQVEAAAITAGLEPEVRPYRPHITIARLNRSNGSLERFLSSHENLSTPHFPVTSACLYESRLRPGGSLYTILERYPLSGGGF